MHLSLASSAVLMLLLLFALGNFVGVQPGQITRDADNLRNLRSQWKKRGLFKSLDKRTNCEAHSCSPSCPDECYCDTNEDTCHPERRGH
uniref:Conotoxin Im9.12 n=1 Tax=Conus imperialis TaxID=35631 RepID=F5C3U2_CONIM|nr:conotoxin Im9.12 [Conus imperialis]